MYTSPEKKLTNYTLAHMTDSSEKMPSPETAPKRNNKTSIIIALMAIIIIIQGIKIYLDTKEKQEVKTQLTTTEEELATTMQRMRDIQTELDQKIAEVTKLGGDVADLEVAKAEIENELKRNKRATGKEIKALKDRVEGYELLLKNKDEEIEKLKSVNKELLTENKSLKSQKNQLGGLHQPIEPDQAGPGFQGSHCLAAESRKHPYSSAE